MSVQQALDKIVDRHPDVIGVVMQADGETWHNLQSPYDMISTDAVMETFGDIFNQTEMLAEDGRPFSEIMLDFEQHSLLAKSMDGGTLMVVAPRLQRGQLVKLQVGLGLFGKAIMKAIAEEQSEAANTPAPVAAAAPAPAPAPVPAPEPQAEVPEAVSEALDAFASAKAIADAGEDPGSVSDIPRASGRRSAVANLLSRRSGGVEPAPQPAPAPEPAAAADPNSPVHPDGRPKKKRVYRGVVYWE